MMKMEFEEERSNEGEKTKTSKRRYIAMATVVTLLLTCLSIAFVVTFKIAPSDGRKEVVADDDAIVQSQNNTIDYDALKKAILASFKCHKNPGMVVSIVKDGKTVLSEAYGVTLPGSGQAVTRDTKFMIASLTKAFSAALMVNVLGDNASNKSYAITEPLSHILGGGFAFADEERTRYATAEDLLSHRIGLPNKMFIRFNPSLNRSELIDLARYWKSPYQFRSKAKYSSLGYSLAAAITERVAGNQSWEDLATDRILRPLGMNSTGFAFSTNFSAHDVAKPYSIYGEREAPINPVFTRVWNSRCGSGCIMSTARDMEKWINFILSKGKNSHNDQVFPANQVEDLTKIRTYLRSKSRDTIHKPIFPETSVADEYGLGWRNGLYRGLKVVSHSGSSPGYASFLVLQPDSNLGIFIAMNGDDEGYRFRLPLTHYIFDVMMKEQPWLNLTTLCTFPSPWKLPRSGRKQFPDEPPNSTLPLESYIGAYKSQMYGEAFVNYNITTTSLQGFYGVGSWQLVPQKAKPNTFDGKGMWATDFWDMSGFEFLPAESDPTNITQLVVHGFDKADPPTFYREFS